MPGVYAQGLCTMQSQPSIHSLSRGKGDRDNKSEVYFKNRLFLQTEKSLALRQDSFAFYLEYYMQLMQLFALLSGI